MSTKTLVKQEVGTWSETFPDQLTSFKQSLIFMKRLLGVAICNITYLRLMFPDDAYVDKSLEGIHLKVLKNSEKYPQVNHLINCLKGVFEALEKKYLKTLVFLIHPDPNNPSVVLDSFAFHFSYDNDTEISLYNKKKEKVACMKSGEKTKEGTKRLLRRLIVLCSTLQPLPHIFSISMKLYYYDDVTPTEYEPPGFDAADSEDIFSGPSKLIPIGEIDTPYHSCSLQLTTKKDELDDEDDDAVQATPGDLSCKNMTNNNKDGNKTHNNNGVVNSKSKSGSSSCSGGDAGGASDDTNVEDINHSVNNLNIYNANNNNNNNNNNHLDKNVSNNANDNSEIEPEAEPATIGSKKKSHKKADKSQSSQRASKSNKAKYAERNDGDEVENEDLNPSRKCKEMKLSTSSKININVSESEVGEVKRKGRRHRQ